MTPDTAKALIEAADAAIECEKKGRAYCLGQEFVTFKRRANPSTIKQLAEAYLGIVEENERLHEALKFYADPDSYFDRPSKPDGPYCPEYPVLSDRGSRARDVLEANK